MTNPGEEGSRWLTSPLLETIGSVIPGFDVAKAMSDAGSRSVGNKIASDERLGRKHGVIGVPFFLVARRDKPLKPLELNDYTPIAFERPIDRLLRKRKN